MMSYTVIDNECVTSASDYVISNATSSADWRIEQWMWNDTSSNVTYKYFTDDIYQPPYDADQAYGVCGHEVSPYLGAAHYEGWLCLKCTVVYDVWDVR